MYFGVFCKFCIDGSGDPVTDSQDLYIGGGNFIDACGVSGISIIISSIDMLKLDNRKVLDSSSEIDVHVNQLDSNMQELIGIASDYEEN
jgi:hypothetical protein